MSGQSKFADLENKAAGDSTPQDQSLGWWFKFSNRKRDSALCPAWNGMLEAVRYIRARDGDIRSLYGNLYGQEKNFITSSMARSNLYLHGLEDFTIARGDTLLEPAFIEAGALQKFDVVIANPPFSLKNWGHENGQGSLGPMCTECHQQRTATMLGWTHDCFLKKNGRMAVVLPQGAFQNGFWR